MKTIAKFIMAITLVIFSACNSDEQQNAKQTTAAGIQVIQFHS